MAFKTLDTEGKWVFIVEELWRPFTQFGKPFAQDEMDELLNAALTSNTKEIDYKTFDHQLILKEEHKL